MPRIRRGAAVVDLGCWPGSWLQVLAERVGPEGRIVGVDIEPVSPLGDPVVVLQLDLTEPDAIDRVAEALGRPADAVLSDAAPKLTGIRDVDRAAIEELYEAALAVAGRVLAPEGSLVVKGFPGPTADAFRKELRRRFPHVAELHLEASRTTSKEFYWLAGPASRGGARPTPKGRGGGARRGTRA